MKANFTTRLRSRAHRANIRIPETVESRLYDYFELLKRWNAKVNLTAFSLNPPSAAALDRLFVEPLSVATSLPTSAAVWFDLGSGGGSPAIPIKLFRPTLMLTLVESKSRKASFLREAIRQLELENAVVENARFETLLSRADVACRADLVTVRAVRLDEALILVCRHLLRPGGRLITFGARSTIPGFVRDPDTGFVERST